MTKKEQIIESLGVWRDKLPITTPVQWNMPDMNILPLVRSNLSLLISAIEENLEDKEEPLNG